MAGIKISNLPAAASAESTDVFPADQTDLVTRKITLAQVSELFNDDFVQLNPPGNQTITANSLSLAAGSFSATTGLFNSGSAAGGIPGSFRAFSNTANLGSVALTAANNAGNFANVLTNASTAAARTWTLPDATGTIALTSGASGIINAGTINQLAFYAAAGTTLSGVGPGSTGQLFQSNGAGSPPAYTTATYPTTTTINQILFSSAGNTVTGIAATAGGVLVSNSTSVPSMLANPSATGRVLSSVSGDTPVWSTATFPTTAGAAGTILRSNGTNWIASTSTFADTYTANNLLVASSTNTVTGLASANNGLLVTNGSGVPSIGNTVGANITVNTVGFGLGAAGVANNIFIGNAGSAGTTGDVNLIIGGTGAGGALTTGNSNIGIGLASLAACQTGASNVGVGRNTLAAATGSDGTAIGARALISVTSGSGNVGVGSGAGRAVAAGAADITTGSSNTFIGTSASGNNLATLGAIAIGRNAVATIATGSTSGTNGPGISIGSGTFPVGFRGDASIFPSTIGSGFWRPTINGTAYMIPLLTDGATGFVYTKVNGTEAANAVTASGQAGVITTSSLTTAAAGSYAITWTNTFITATSGINLCIVGGTNTRQNIQFTCVPGAGTATLTIFNNEPVNALNGTILISYQVF